MHDSILHQVTEGNYCEKSPESPTTSLSHTKSISLDFRRPGAKHLATKLSFSSIQHAKFHYSDSFFSKSKLVIMGGSFVAHMGSENENLHGWNMLAEKIAKDVFRDSARRFPLPRSSDRQHTEVGTQVINLIMEQTTSTRIIRIHGASGTSEIAQHISEYCSRSNIRPITFFFRGLKEEYFSSFIPTIAYQLCLIFPKLRKLVSQAIDDDPAILSRSPLAQLEALIISPFINIRRSWLPDGPDTKLVVIVDAIHKCSSAHQRLLVQVISSMAERFAFPATFLIFNKPTTDIEFTFHEYANTQPIIINIRRKKLFKPLIRRFVLCSRTIFHFHCFNAPFHSV